MPLAPLGTLDLSLVTDRLIAVLRDCTTDSPMWRDNGGTVDRFTIDLSGAMPEAVRNQGGCILTVYLLHVSQHPFQRNATFDGRVLTRPFQPMSLDLYYLLTSFAGDNYRQEQRAMSLALRCFHQTPILRFTVPIEGVNEPEEVVLSMEVETADSLARYWQAFSTAYRLSAVYKVAVTFLTPTQPSGSLAPPPTRVVLGGGPGDLPFAAGGQVAGTTSRVDYHGPGGTAATPQELGYDTAPAVVAAGDSFLLLGAGLGGPTSARVYLLPAVGGEQEITAWLHPGPNRHTSSRVELVVPATATPDPGVYQLRVGSDVAAGDAATHRSNSTPFQIAALVGPVTDPPVLAPTAGVYTVAGAGFAPGTTEVALGTVALAETAGAPGPGQFRVGAGGTSVAFRLPPGLPTGRHDLQVRVNGVQSRPSWWVDAP
ncbi:MAG TPA: DUF4255 domain-containing protein [Acidimicrobiales bacterium]|nr:DUF4255 domain-containing protein [Acidimicrobiales bacterium]